MVITKNIFYIALILGFLAVSITACANDNILEELKISFIKDITSEMEKHKVKVISDEKEGKKEFLKKSLPGVYIPKNEEIKKNDIFITEEGDKGFYHLGVISLSYPTSKDAAISFNTMIDKNKFKYFQNTKILTKFKFFIKDKYIVFVYSETFIEEKVNKFILKQH